MVVPAGRLYAGLVLKTTVNRTMEPAMKDSPVTTLATLRMIVGYLGERAQFGW